MNQSLQHCAVSIAFSTVLSGSALAAESTNDEVLAGRYDEEVIVYARHRAENVQKVPIPVSAVSGGDLKDRAAEDLRDLTRITPNLDFTNSGVNKNSSVVFMRGIGQVNWAPTQDPKIGTYSDGVYLGRPQGGVFDLLDVERVEVLRGPQGSLFGRNTTAGLVNVISNRPESRYDASFTGGFGSDGALNGDAMVNIPFTDDLAARLAFQHRESDGYVKNTGTGEDWNDENAQQARLSLRWTPTDDFVGDLIIDYQKVDENSSLGSCEWTEPADGSQSTAFLPSMAFVFGIYDELRDTCNGTTPFVSNENDPAASTVDALGVTLDLGFDFGWAELKSITSYRTMEDFNGSWGFASDTVGSPSFLEVIGGRDDESDQWSHEMRLSGSAVDDNLAWVAGVYLFEEHSFLDIDVPLFRDVAAPDCAVWPVWCLPSGIDDFPTLGDFATAIQVFQSRHQYVDANNRSKAVFGEVTWRFADDWAVTAGARYTRDNRDFERSETLLIGIPDPALVCPPGTPAPLDGTTCFTSKDFSEVSPRIIFSWDASDDVMLYFGWSEGYSSGGFNQDVRMRAFEPEISGNWEGGVKSTWLDNLVLVNLTAFHNSYENQQITVSRLVDGNPAADLINAQEATLFGIEGEFRAELPANFYMQGSFGWLNGEYDEFTVQDNVIGGPPDFAESIVTRDLQDSKMVRGAPYTYSLSIGTSRVIGNGATLDGQIGWAFRGRSYNTLEALPSSRQGKYGLLDTRIVYGFANGQTSVSVWGTNLLDRTYFPYAVDLSAGDSRSGFVTKYWAEPRRFGIELTHRMN